MPPARGRRVNVMECSAKARMQARRLGGVNAGWRATLEYNSSPSVRQVMLGHVGM